MAYTGTFGERTTFGAAFYVNDLDNNINFAQLPTTLDPYTAANPPPGWPLPPGDSDRCWRSAGFFCRGPAFTYLNLGPMRQKGLELSVDHRVDRALTAFANYSWQGEAVDSRRSASVSGAGAGAAADQPVQRRRQLRRRRGSSAARR